MARDHPRGPEVEEEGLAGEVAPLLQLAVQLGELERVRLGDVLVEHEREEGPVREDGGVAGDEDAVVQRDGRKVKERREDRLDDGDDQPAVDHKLRERRRAHVAVAAVPQHQPPQVRELLQRKVGGERRLPPLAPLDADADVRRLDHADVVAAVADGGGARLWLRHPDQLHDLRLLGGGAAAADDGGRGASNLHEELLVVRDAEREGGAVEDEARRVELALRVTLQRLPRLAPPLLLVARRADGDLVHALPPRDERRVLRDDPRRLELVPRQHPRPHLRRECLSAQRPRARCTARIGTPRVRVAKRLERRAHVRLRLTLGPSRGAAEVAAISRGVPRLACSRSSTAVTQSSRMSSCSISHAARVASARPARASCAAPTGIQEASHGALADGPARALRRAVRAREGVELRLREVARLRCAVHTPPYTPR